MDGQPVPGLKARGRRGNDQRRKGSLQRFDFGEVPGQDVRVVGILHQEVLVVVLSRIERCKLRDFGHDGLVEALGRGQRGQVGGGNGLLSGSLHEQGRPVLGAVVRALIVQLGGISGHGEEDLKQGSVRDN